MQLYYFWKKLSVDYKVTHLGGNTDMAIDSGSSTPAVVNAAPVHHPEVRAHVCEMPDCSAVSYLRYCVFVICIFIH